MFFNFWNCSEFVFQLRCTGVMKGTFLFWWWTVVPNMWWGESTEGIKQAAKKSVYLDKPNAILASTLVCWTHRFSPARHTLCLCLSFCPFSWEDFIQVFCSLQHWCRNISYSLHPVVCGLWVFGLFVCLPACIPACFRTFQSYSRVYFPSMPLRLCWTLPAFLSSARGPSHPFSWAQRPRAGLSCEFYLMDQWFFVFGFFQLVQNTCPLSC